jgi:hypothetical protein
MRFPNTYFLQFLDWFVRISDLSIHLKNEPTYLISQFAFIFGGLVTFLHGMYAKVIVTQYSQT